ncbi:potassium/proton antiporter [Branchiibius cervicis]|uniref:Potassium/proton antiporter n=1 Tax=Branchiibius cervicis TaxID=908252 RepID=A0ABW2AVB3_9MICO
MLPSSVSAITSFTPEDLTRTLVIGSLVLLVSVAAVRLANKSGLPTLLLYLGIGLILGEAGLGIQFSDPRLTQVFGYSALALILAEGGLTTSWSSIRRSVAPAAVLSTVGVLVSVAVVGVAAHYLLDLNWQVAFLLGAITSSTDAAAVFSVLRRVPLPHRLTGVLEAESGFNDAPVVLIVVALAEGAAHRNESPWWLVVIEASLELVGGAAIGLAIGWAGSWIAHRVTPTSSALFSLAILSLTVLAYGVADLAHTSGFIAAYLCALVIGNQRLPHRQATRSFAQALGWLAQIGLFVMLGLLASPKRLMDQLVPAIVIGVVLLLLARPLSVLVSLAPFRFTPAKWRSCPGRVCAVRCRSCSRPFR